MSEAGGTGQAGPAEAVTANGAGEPLHVRQAYALAEADAADEVVTRMEAKVAKAKQAAKDMVATATAALAEAQAAAKAANEHALSLGQEEG